MSDRWYIFKDGRQIGPLGADEIRRGLREGEFDPFDLVAREGSNLRREVVEVDELFFTSKATYDGQAPAANMMVATQQVVDHRQTFEPGAFPVPAQGMRMQDGQRPPTLLGQGHLALADEAAGEMAMPNPGFEPNAVRRQRDPKHFLVMNSNGRVLGPMSASEVQSLYYRGVLSADVSVMRQGSEAKVQLSRFIAVMSGNRSPNVQKQGAHPVSDLIRAVLPGPQPRLMFGSSARGIPMAAAIALAAAFAIFSGSGLLLLEHKTGKLSALAAKIFRGNDPAAHPKHRKKHKPKGAAPAQGQAGGVLPAGPVQTGQFPGAQPRTLQGQALGQGQVQAPARALPVAAPGQRALPQGDALPQAQVVPQVAPAQYGPLPAGVMPPQEGAPQPEVQAPPARSRGRAPKGKHKPAKPAATQRYIPR